MGSTAIALAQAAAAEMGLPLPQYLYTAQDNTSRQFGALFNRLGQMLLRAHNWTFLTREFHISVPAPIVDTGTLTLGSGTIAGLLPATVTILNPFVGLMIVAGQGIMQSVRLIGCNISAHTATIDQPATASGTVQVTFGQDTFPLPVDYTRSILRTAWDRSMRWELRGPQSPQWDQWVRSGIVATGPRRMYREVNNAWRIWPPPGSSVQDTGSQMLTEYVSSNWAQDAGGTGKLKFTADTDTSLFQDDLMISGLKYLFFSIKGFVADDLKMQFQRILQAEVAMDGPSPTLDMTRSRFPIFISPANVQDANFPGSFGNP
jgi:hypothetical protein